MDLRHMLCSFLLFALVATAAFKIHRATLTRHKVETEVEHSVIGSPPCIQMYNAIEKYSEKYDVPKKYAYGLAYEETRFQGPFDWTYQCDAAHLFWTSPVGARGPFQIMPSTYVLMWPDRPRISDDELCHNIDLNVETGMKTIRHLFDTYHDWKLAFGAYNTGSPMVNQYAENVYSYNHNKILAWRQSK